MVNWKVLLLVVSFVAIGATAQDTEETLLLSGDPVVEEIRVVGEMSGPPIWKITKDEHALWILGYPEWVHDDSLWKSDFVEDVMAHSNEWITFTGARYTSLNPLKMAQALRKFRRMQRIPDRGTLDSVLSTDAYQLFIGVKLSYAPKRDDLERLRPSFASKELFESAAESAGLVKGRRTIHRAMKQRARKHRVTEIRGSISLNDLAVLDSMAETLPNAEQTCLQRRLQGLDGHLETISRLAAAWVEGDLTLIRVFSDDVVEDSCDPRSLVSQPEALMQLVSSSQEIWDNNVDRALRENASTFAMLPLEDLLDDDGPLLRFQEGGYEIRVF